MRRLIPLLAMLIIAAWHVAPAAAQEVGDALTATGCLAQDDDGEPEFVLANALRGEATVAEIDLGAAEGVALAPHVGHTVEITGVVIADDDEDEDEEEGEEEEGDENELHARVTAMSHVAASCEGQAR